MDPFIRWYDKALSTETCRDIISRFDADKRKIVGKVSGNHGPEVDLKGKQTTELILPDEGWSDVKHALTRNLIETLQTYTRDVKFLAASDHKELYIEPLRIKKYDIGGQFSWHIDCNSSQNHTRVLAAQWYFNDVAEGGRTEFEDQAMAIDCVEGRLAFFPVAWTYRHRGAPPVSGPKYVCTTFIHRRF
ncbi:2OG-Fe(II) oxygenase family protein [Rhodoligotrophos ferricapiens]|uniref:2OG-Fe(II) oxygenase family protein n=1 Tax=Rhodoligotrophos ferricapiens TaxID=3069264 RepID=UPI00315C6655